MADIRQIGYFKRAGDIRGQLFFPPAHGLRFHRQRFQRFDCGNGFDQKSLIFRTVFEFFFHSFVQNGRSQQRQNDIERNGQRDNQR